MAEETATASGPLRSREEIALDMMKFIAVTTGYGKGMPVTGFSGKPNRTAEEYAEALLELYRKCRDVIAK